MARENAADQLITKEIMIAYIHSLGPNASILLKKPGREPAAEQTFSEVWDTILKTVSGQARAVDKH